MPREPSARAFQIRGRGSSPRGERVRSRKPEGPRPKRPLKDRETRRAIIEDTMDELSNEILERAFLYRLLVEYRPDVVIDCINTATAFAYQDVFYSVRKVQAAVADVDAGASDAGALRDAIEDHLTTLSLPR